jgi:hypothetical protein
LQSKDDLYQRMIDYLDDALLVGVPQIITDPDMMFGSAVFALHELHPSDVPA